MDKVTNTDAYAQVEWAVHPRWIASGGVRVSRVRFDSRGRFFEPAPERNALAGVQASFAF